MSAAHKYGQSPSNPSPRQARRLSIGCVDLLVTDIKRSTQFWTSALGFIPREAGGAEAALGTRQRTLVKLYPGADEPATRSKAGICRVAFSLHSPFEFTRLTQRLSLYRIPYSITSNAQIKSLFLYDPDGHCIEFSHMAPAHCHRSSGTTNVISLIDSERFRRKAYFRSDLHFTRHTDSVSAINGDAYITTLHLSVSALETAYAWFEELGFEQQQILPQLGMADIGLGVSKPLRLSVNHWAADDTVAPSVSNARVLRYSLETDDPVLFDRASAHLSVHLQSKALAGFDPAGVALTLELLSAGY